MDSLLQGLTQPVVAHLPLRLHDHCCLPLGEGLEVGVLHIRAQVRPPPATPKTQYFVSKGHQMSVSMILGIDYIHAAVSAVMGWQLLLALARQQQQGTCGCSLCLCALAAHWPPCSTASRHNVRQARSRWHPPANKRSGLSGMPCRATLRVDL